MPILYNLEQNKNFLKFIDDDFKLEDKNIYTFLVGKNSVGKSRLLRSIIIHALEENRFNQIIPNIINSPHTMNCQAKIFLLIANIQDYLLRLEHQYYQVDMIMKEEITTLIHN